MYCFGTKRLRKCRKQREGNFRKIKDATEIETKIISGDEEARFIYKRVNLL